MSEGVGWSKPRLRWNNIRTPGVCRFVAIRRPDLTGGSCGSLGPGTGHAPDEPLLGDRGEPAPEVDFYLVAGSRVAARWLPSRETAARWPPYVRSEKPVSTTSAKPESPNRRRECLVTRSRKVLRAKSLAWASTGRSV